MKRTFILTALVGLNAYLAYQIAPAIISVVRTAFGT